MSVYYRGRHIGLSIVCFQQVSIDFQLGICHGDGYICQQRITDATSCQALDPVIILPCVQVRFIAFQHEMSQTEKRVPVLFVFLQKFLSLCITMIVSVVIYIESTIHSLLLLSPRFLINLMWWIAILAVAQDGLVYSTAGYPSDPVHNKMSWLTYLLITRRSVGRSKGHLFTQTYLVSCRMLGE